MCFSLVHLTPATLKSKVTNTKGLAEILLVSAHKIALPVFWAHNIPLRYGSSAYSSGLYEIKRNVLHIMSTLFSKVDTYNWYLSLSIIFVLGCMYVV